MLVYVARHRQTGKEYVGATRRGLQSRIYEHTKVKSKYDTLLGRVISEEGIAAFDWSVVWTGDSREEMWSMERAIIAERCTQAPHGFNRSSGGSKGYKHHPDTVAKIVLLKTGIKRNNPSWARGLNKETDERVRLRAEKQVGIPKSEQHKAALSASKRGRTCPYVSESNRRRSGENSSLSKPVRVFFPDGTSEDVVGISAFCRKHGLNRVRLGLTALGKAASHKGFRCERLTRIEAA